MSQAPRLAIVDRDSGFVQVLARRLQALGWTFRVHGGPVTPEEIMAMRVNAVVVDPTVLGPDAGAELARLCSRLPALAIIVCTGRSSVVDRVRGLRLGADDWVTKPVHPEELIARVEAVLRRARRGANRAERAPIVAGELEIRSDRYQAFAAGRSLELTRREFELLHLLAEAQGRVLEREEIYERVWGYAMVRGDRSVDVFVRKLRRKLEAGSPGWAYIHTHFGVGYRFAAEPVAGAPDEALVTAR